MTSQLLPRGLGLGLLLVLTQLSATSAWGTEQPDGVPVVESGSFEHRFGLTVGYTHVARVDINALPQRFDYTLIWRGWGVGPVFIFDLRAKGATRDSITCVGLALRRSLAIGDDRLWMGAELGTARLSRDFTYGGERFLYHGTTSAVELGYEFNHTAAVRAFFSFRVELPWFTTEVENLTPVDQVGPDGVVLIEHSSEWTPIYGFWGGVAL